MEKTEEPDIGQVPCDVCGMDMQNPGKNDATIGVVFHLSNCKEAERAEKMFGKTNFKICPICCLKSLGIKEA